MATKTVHIHAQRKVEDVLEIAGTREGLRAFASLLRQAAAAPDGAAAARLFDAAGRPYGVLVLCDPSDPKSSQSWAESAAPYLHKDERSPTDKKYPFDIIGWEKVRDLFKKVGLK